MAGVAPFAYLRDLSSLRPAAEAAELRTLTPRAWAAGLAEDPTQGREVNLPVRTTPQMSVPRRPGIGLRR